jgi:hypothetical protein
MNIQFRRLPAGLAAALIVAALPADAATSVSDVDYLKAGRCKGLAVGLSLKSGALDDFLRTQGRSRSQPGLELTAEQQRRAERASRNADLRQRLTAEFANQCARYIGDPQPRPRLAGAASPAEGH